MHPERVLLVQMPMGLVQVPSLALSLLKPGLARAGTPCDVRYLNLEFVKQFLGGEAAMGAYVRLVEHQPLAEACAAQFSSLRFGRDPARDEIVQGIIKTATGEQRQLFDAIARCAGPFLDYCLEAVDWSQYALVGFTSLFPGMTMPSVVLAGRLKERFPHLRVVLGGWNTSGAMGEALAEKFVDELDFVLRGEVDETLPSLAAAVVAGTDVDVNLPGLLTARTNRARAVPQPLVSNLDAVPFPDFDDYFTAIADIGDAADPAKHIRSLSFESSRGCWWGQVSHCKFCGLNGLSMPFRSKSPGRMIAELDHIVGRYQPSLLFATDTIIDGKYFTELLPLISGRYPDVRFAYEVKAPVTREQMQALAGAHVSDITVGIESLATRILHLMGKGTTSLQNIHCLKMGAETGVNVGWQHLIGFPAEALDDYLGAAALMSRLHHLSPPERACSVAVARFSPYFDRAAELKVGNLRPRPEYVASYPWPIADVSRVAYHFDFDHEDGRDATLTSRIGGTMSAAVSDWRDCNATARLDAYRGGSITAVVDTRSDRHVVYILDGLARDVYETLDVPLAEAALLARLLERRRGTPIDWVGRLLVGDEAESDLLAWVVEHARAIGAAVVRLNADDGLSGDGDEFRDAVLDALHRLDQAELIVSEAQRHLALAVRRDRTDASPLEADCVRAGGEVPASPSGMPAWASQQ